MSDWSHRSGLVPAECGIMVTVESDRTGDKVMRSVPHDENRGLPHDAKQLVVPVPSRCQETAAMTRHPEPAECPLLDTTPLSTSMGSATVLGAVKGRALTRAPQRVSSLDPPCAPWLLEVVGTRGVLIPSTAPPAGRTKGVRLEGCGKSGSIFDADDGSVSRVNLLTRPAELGAHYFCNFSLLQFFA